VDVNSSSRKEFVMPSVVVLDPSGDSLLDAFEAWLVRRRGLAVVTARNYSRLVRPFIASFTAPAADAVRGLDAGAVVSFMVCYCRDRNTGTAKAFARSLCSFFRFAYATGVTSADLSGAVPSAAG
jgi:site-specific recombinase XerD